MLENICEKIKQTLGPHFVVFYAEKDIALTEEEKEEYASKAVGVFYPSSGQFSELEGMQGMEGSAMLQLLIPTESQNNFNYLQHAMESLIAASNGELEENDGAGRVYVINWQLPTPAGDVEHIFGCRRQIWNVPMNIVVSATTLLFGNDFSLTVDGIALTGITAWNKSVTNAVNPRISAESYIATNMQTHKEYQLSVEAIVQDTDIWEQLQEDADGSAEKVYTIVFSANGITRTFSAVMTQFQHAGQIGRFQVARLVFVDNYVSGV